MTQDVTQWLDEIKALKQRLAEAQQEREAAYASAISWQRLYETEAQQRRSEARTARQTIAALQQEINQLKGRFSSTSGETVESPAQALVDSLTTEAELRSRLVQALQECDRLTQALQTEQADHAQTRKNLTTALGDAIATLAKDRLPE
ncbi:hypothetical protein [Leptodesmis sp.]|uniref:hypothetical protein n=1 Tax=Leptodesmis sp. TaxID=3100501 RepID=UPI0040534E98